jgi:hypothetical protein
VKTALVYGRSIAGDKGIEAGPVLLGGGDQLVFSDGGRDGNPECRTSRRAESFGIVRIHGPL